jgi:hypothetical protein
MVDIENMSDAERKAVEAFRAGKSKPYVDPVDIQNRLESIIENLEIVYNYGPAGLLVNWEEHLMTQCRRLKEIQEEL